MDPGEIKGAPGFRQNPAPEAAADTGHAGFLLGRVISPGSALQLGAYGLFPPSSVQQRILTPTTQPLTAKSAGGELLWMSFAELCGGLASTADYLALAAEYRTWVIDDVPSPAVESSAGTASAWQRFSNMVDVVYDQDITLFLIGIGPLDWDAAASGPTGSRPTSPADMARVAHTLSLLARVQSADERSTEEMSGS
ncbi:AFG1/ZapE family ATPase [Micrococcaceae bacterium Sec5.7]